MRAHSSLPWSCFTKLQGKVTSFLSRGGLYGGATGVYLLSNFHLFRTRYVRYFMNILCVCFISFFYLAWEEF